MLSFKMNVKTAIDTKKIQEEASKAAVHILVGFPSGRQHVPTLHKNQEGNYESYNHGDPKDEQPIETAELAKMLSYGSATIPPRPFLEEGIESKKKELKAAMQEEAKSALNGNKANWNKVGTMAVGAIQEFVHSDYYRQSVPNSPKTIAYKGSDTPLIDGADLINSTSFIVLGGKE